MMKRALKQSIFVFATFKSESSYLNEKCGTICYIASEIIIGNYYYEKYDVYGLAQIFHVLLTGKPIYDRNMGKQKIFTLSKQNKFPINYRGIQCSKAVKLYRRCF